ncbi:MAG: hypothetical protein AAGF12_25010 [Myxococcota bacterium]
MRFPSPALHLPVGFLRACLLAGSLLAPAVLGGSVLGGCSFISDFDRFTTDQADGGIDAAGDRNVDAPVDTGQDVAPDAPMDAPVDGDGGQPLNEDDFKTRFADIFCGKTVSCESKLGIGALLQILCHPVGIDFFANDFLGGGSDWVFNEAAARTCLEELDIPGCRLEDLPSSCRMVYNGQLGPGDTCDANTECRNGFCNRPELACGGQCMPLLDEGQACDDEYECRSGFLCTGDVCRRPIAQNAACAGGGCDSFLYCNETSNRCVPFESRGTSCERSLGIDPCEGSLVCFGATGSSTCEDGREDGEACASSRPCAPGFRCLDSGVCRPIRRAGETCDASDECVALHTCVDTRCVPQPDVGGTCNPQSPCIRGNCQNGTCTLLGPGNSCSDDLECASTSCEANRCRSRLAQGNDCSAGVCQLNLFCDDGRTGSGNCEPCPR